MPNETYEFHPIANIFPMFAESDLAELAADIASHGLHEPICLYEGKILDGRNRYTACNIANVAIQTRDFIGSALDALAWVWSLNRQRRHLTPSQAAIADAKREQLYGVYAGVKEAAQERQGLTRLAGRDSEGNPLRVEPSVSQQIDSPKEDRNDRKTDAIRAETAGTNRTYISIADKLVAERPELVAQVESGQKTLSQVNRELRREELQQRTPPPPTGKYRVFYADPPWKYNDALAISKDGLGESYGPADAHYPQMTIADLCALPIRDLAEDDAVLFLWTTSPLLEESFKVVSAWGFKYKSSFVWDKVKHNMGHYNSVRHEFLLVCTRGSCTPDVRKLFDSVQAIERSERHSEKPEEFRGIIDTLYPSGERIELFARSAHEGWQKWGNEA